MSIAPPHMVILASAGTGKTHTLTSRYLSLVAAGESPERILATTFTRKAAGEILRKIVMRLGEGAGSSKAAAELGRQIGAPGLTTADCVRLLTGMARSLDRLSIGTIDSFFAKLAAGNALTIGGREWRMIDEDEDADLRSEAVSRVLHTGERAEVLELVRLRNPGMAGRSVHADLLGAVDQAYREFLASDREAWGALMVPPPMVAEDLARAIAALGAMTVPTTKSGSENANWRKAKEKALVAARAGEWGEFIEVGLVAKLIAGESSYSRVEIRPDVCGVIQPLIGHAAAVLLGPLRARTMATRGMLERFDAAYRAIKESRGLCTFDDIPRVLLQHSATDSMRDMYYRLDARLHHVLLDEFQDTSVVQWRLLEPVVDEIVSQGEERSLLCVGDVKQSLYAWRNAEPELLGSIPTRWPHVKREDLLASYRSSQVVIDAVNDVMGGIDHNPALDGGRDSEGVRRAKSRWKGMFKPHTTNRKLPGFCRLTVSPAETDTTPLKDASLRAAAGRVKELQDAAPHLSVGVLFRSRKLIAPMKLELARLGIHASEEGGNPLADSPGVAAVLSMLMLADHPGNTAALFHVATSPLGPIVGLRFPGSPDVVARVAARVRLRILAEGFAGVLEDWLRQIAPACSERDARRLDQLVSLAVRFDERSAQEPSTRASAFVDFVKRRRVEDPTAAPVRLMTVHASKGLEFDSVVLPWLDDRIADKPPAVLEDRPDDDPLAAPSMIALFPGKSLVALSTDLSRLYERWRGRQVLEELCVLYVALTRAVHCVEMFVPPSEKELAQDDGSSLSFAKIVRGALSPGEAAPGDVLWTHGDPAWAQQIAVEQSAVTKKASTSMPAQSRRHATLGIDMPAVPAIRLDLGDTARTRHVPRRSPSSAGEFVGGAGWPGLDEEAQSAARTRGVLFHAWLEMIEWLDGGVPGDQELLDAAGKTGLVPPADLPGLLREFRAALGRRPLRDLLSRSAYRGASVEVRRELPFAATERAGGDGAPSLVMGRIDRVVIVRDARGSVERAEVIDYKTDQLTDASPAGLELHAETYRGQMADYRATVARLLGCPEGVVKTRLVFITHDAVVDM